MRSGATIMVVIWFKERAATRAGPAPQPAVSSRARTAGCTRGMLPEAVAALAGGEGENSGERL